MPFEHDGSNGQLKLVGLKLIQYDNSHQEVERWGPFMTRMEAIMKGAQLALDRNLKFEDRK